jgi:deazaflavin-dependent oxidoreductase (nitroreductase family)
MSTSAADFNSQVIAEFRANDGVVGGMFAGARILLLHHTGAKSGQSYVTPLVCRKDGEDYVIFASKAGAPTNPDWYHNLKAHPEVTIEVGSDTVPVIASEAEGERRARLYAEQVHDMPTFADYQEKAGRIIPVIVLTPSVS